MNSALALCLFALERVRTVLLALSIIVLVKIALVLAAPALS
jgi:hypothetical protein